MAMFDIWPGVNLSRFLPSTVSKLLLVIARHRVKHCIRHLLSSIHILFVLWLKAPVNNYVVTFGQSHFFLGKSTQRSKYVLPKARNTAPKLGRNQDLSTWCPTAYHFAAATLSINLSDLYLLGCE